MTLSESSRAAVATMVLCAMCGYVSSLQAQRARRVRASHPEAVATPPVETTETTSDVVDASAPEVSEVSEVPAEENAVEPEAAIVAPTGHTLRELSEIAVRSYPGLRAAEARIRAARAQLDEIWVAPFFQSHITAGFTLAPEARGSPIFSPDSQLPVRNPWQPVAQFGIEGVVPLWTFGKLGAAREAGRAGVRAAEHDRVRVRNQLLFDLRRAYFALQLSLDLQQMLREGLPRIQSSIERIEERLAEGDPEVSDVDRYKLVAALSEVQGRQAQAQHLEHSSRAALQILSGLADVEIPECPIESATFELGTREHYVTSALSSRPETRMLEAARRAREASLDATRAGFWPDIGLAYRFGTSYAPGITDQTNPFIIDPANFSSIGAGVVMRWSLDFWGNVYRVDREIANLEDVRLRSEEAARGITLEVTDAYETVLEAQARVEAFSRGHRETRAWFISVSQGLDVGAATMNDLVDAVRAYFQARFNHLQAVHDLNSGLANLERTSAVPVVERWEATCD